VIALLLAACPAFLLYQEWQTHEIRLAMSEAKRDLIRLENDVKLGPSLKVSNADGKSIPTSELVGSLVQIGNSFSEKIIPTPTLYDQDFDLDFPVRINSFSLSFLSIPICPPYRNLSS
jgi:hypothetical protein